MREIRRTNQFKRDYKLAGRRGKKLERLQQVIELLAKDEPLPVRHRRTR